MIRLWGFLIIPLLLGPSQISGANNMPENKGSISQESTYTNPTLGLTLVLPGSWRFFDKTTYLTAQQKQEEEGKKIAAANCQGLLCGNGEIDVALQTMESQPLSSATNPPKMAVYLIAYKLAAEYQDRKRYPLGKFAEVMGARSLKAANWVPESEPTVVQLGGKDVYRSIVHAQGNSSEKGFMYVADSNERIFMLLAVAMSDPEQLQAAVERMKIAANGTARGNGVDAGSSGIVGLGAGTGLGFKGVDHVGNGVTAPVPIYTPNPDFTLEARKAKYYGTVVLTVSIGPDGLVHSAKVIRSLGMGLDEKAIEKVLTWKFKPATKNSKPVAVEINVEVSFNLY
jgi:TonB family protein